MSERRTFEIEVSWRRCACGRYYGCETSRVSTSCTPCAVATEERTRRFETERADRNAAEVARLARSNISLRGVITRMKGRR